MAKRESFDRDARAALAEYLKPGATISCILRHVSSSGMHRRISLLANVTLHDGETVLMDLDSLICRAYPGAFRQQWRNGSRLAGVVAGGCGMDMGLHLVYNLGRLMFPNGYQCIGDGGGKHRAGCHSNDHMNGDRDYTPHLHHDGGYAFRHEWL